MLGKKKVKKIILGGGSPPPSLEIVRYATEGLKPKSRILFLTIRHGGALKYDQKFREAFYDSGFFDVKIVVGDRVTTVELVAEIQKADVIAIGSGVTLKYYRIFAKGKVKKALVKAYQDGTPLMGFSAGSLIMPETMLISHKDNFFGIRVKRGLGLVKDAVISAHYSKWREHRMLRLGIKRTGVSLGYGIDDDSYLVFENGKPRFFGTIYIEHNPKETS
ncbi:Type 1 glutamine amidotransferase-like domain-containing protein [Carnobacterium gallinarum]|uniref:Type 1 glutamine amidotransferase-like domain-containing protein n=1 Tax=Carnobacterium gallinarum TaxID=2749 RepID=UPI00068A1DC0|nr:Type 1 glutamine amidotransferase-like domain-containing protein [Carnobacterium gallinarum]